MMTAGRPSSSSRAGRSSSTCEVGDEDAVDATLLDQPAVGRVVVVLGDLQQQRVPAGATAPPRGRR